ncbi:MAG: zinc ABC transporter ATP-binding protein ZnuC [Alphaproteobacteria bacterium]|nr:zinc ABC transporter ATP-binding protein ZnuC [Alphaproteobacteria bacterium]
MTESETARPLIRAENLTVNRGGQSVVDNINLTVSAGEIVTLVGPNGAGKSTLIRAILHLIDSDSGRVEREPGVTIGYVPQQLEIDPTMPLDVRRFLRLGALVAEADMKRALEEVGVTEVIDTPMQGLSGGEMRRVLLARALLRDPDLLVLDEPTAGVDFGGQAELYELIRHIRDRRQCGILLVSHNLHLVMAATDRVLCLNHHICCEGQPDAVTRNPAYLELFGSEAVASAMAVYTHHHDHHHDLSGAPVDESDQHNHEHSHG